MSVEVINYKISSTLTGYAYETIPGKPIRAGEIGSQADDFTTGPTANLDSSVPRMPASEVAPETAQPASLGKLALGAQSVQARRQP